MAAVTGIPNPGYEADMLRRAAEACRNAQKQMSGRRDWFDWVPAHLDQLADRLDPRDPEDRGRPFVEIASR